MKNKILYLFMSLAIVFSGCKKTAFDENVNGEALGSFNITAPANNTLLVLNSATPNSKVNITWTGAKPGVSATPTYKFIAALKTGSLDQPILELSSDNNGKATQLTLTQKQLDDALKSKSIADGMKADLIWSVVADNGSVKVKINPAFNISITRMGDGLSNFLLYGPVSSSIPIVLNPNSTTDNLNLKWQKSFPGVITSATKYQVKFVAKGGDFSTPLFTYTTNNLGLDSALNITYKDISDKLTTAGFTDQATPVALQWTVEATSGNFKKTADYVNDIVISREVKMFLVGGDSPIGWNPDKALPMIADVSNPGTFYIYVKLTPGNNGFKFINQLEWPGGSLNSTDWAMQPGTPGTAFDGNGEVNIENYGTAGVYRVTFDQKNLKYYVQADKGRMGIVGAATAMLWTPSAVFPSQALTYIGVNKFLGFVNLTSAAEWKFIDNNDWGNGSISGARDYGKGTTAGLMLESNEANILTPGATGPYRITWDGTDIKNLKYSINTGTLYLIGAATVAGWNENAVNLPPMSYLGNGKWTVTVPLTVGEFKFLMQKGTWAYSYGIGSATGVLADGGGNLSVATTGNYTITVDEFNKTYTVVKI